MNKSFLNAALALCTIGGAVLAVGVAEEPVSKVAHLPGRLFYWSMIAGGLLVGIGLSLILISALFHPVQNVMVRLLYGDINSRYVPVRARNRDLEGLHDLYTKYFGSDVPSIDLMRSWIERYKSAFVLVHRVRQKSGLVTRQQLVGSFKLLPLTLEAVRALEAGQTSGSSFRPDHVARTKGETVAHYVGDVVAISQIARGMVLAHLNAACTPAIKRGSPVYARPLTPDGLRVMTKYGFLQVSDGKSAPEIGRICKLEGNSDLRHTTSTRLTARRRRTKEEVRTGVS